MDKEALKSLQAKTQPNQGLVLFALHTLYFRGETPRAKFYPVTIHVEYLQVQKKIFHRVQQNSPFTSQIMLIGFSKVDYIETLWVSEVIQILDGWKNGRGVMVYWQGSDKPKYC